MFADAPIVGQRPAQAGVTAAALKGLHQIVTSDYTKFDSNCPTRKSVGHSLTGFLQLLSDLPDEF